MASVATATQRALPAGRAATAAQRLAHKNSAVVRGIHPYRVRLGERLRAKGLPVTIYAMGLPVKIYDVGFSWRLSETPAQGAHTRRCVLRNVPVLSATITQSVT